MNNDLLISIDYPVTYVHVKTLYNCRVHSTFVESSLQINSFYAKQSQFPKKSNERK